MRKPLVLLCLLLLLAFTASAQNKSRSWLRGAWEGTGYQTDDDSTWKMQVTFKRIKGGRREGLIEYPALECGGRWKLLSVAGSKARFRELLDHGQEKCSDKGLVTIEKIGGQLIFLYSNQGSHEITASAVLNRKQSPASNRSNALILR